MAISKTLTSAAEVGRVAWKKLQTSAARREVENKKSVWTEALIKPRVCRSSVLPHCSTQNHQKKTASKEENLRLNNLTAPSPRLLTSRLERRQCLDLPEYSRVGITNPEGERPLVHGSSLSAALV